MIIEAFEVECSDGERRVFDAETVFGFFPPEAFADQVGLPPPPTSVRAHGASDAADRPQRRGPTRYFDGPLRLPDPMLLMLDRVTGY